MSDVFPADHSLAADRPVAPNHPVAPANQRLRIALLRLLFVLAFVPLVLGVPGWSAAAEAALRVTGTLCVVGAVLGRFWAILYIGGRKNAEVMQDGPYSICRHPLYLFSTLGVIGFGLLLGSLVFAATLGLLAFGLLSATAAREERFLRASFGHAYTAYAARVPRILPRPWLFHTPAQIVLHLNTLRTNLADAAVFLSTIPVAEAIRLAHDAGLLHGFAVL